MTIATTTFAAIRDGMVNAIRLLTPSEHSDVEYQYAPSELDIPLADFRDWAQEHADACQRWYVIIGGTEQAFDVTNGEVELCSIDCELVMAYPHEFYGDDVQGVADVHDMIRGDQRQILAAIGYRGGASYVSGQRAVSDESSLIETGEEMSFGVLSFGVTYYRS